MLVEKYGISLPSFREYLNKPLFFERYYRKIHGLRGWGEEMTWYELRREKEEFRVFERIFSQLIKEIDEFYCLKRISS